MNRANGIRLAIISTPRAGNNWLQHLLSRCYDLPRLSPVNFPNVRWSDLPKDCVIILHWRREAALCERLRDEGFRVLSIARHPLDVLISILRFTLREMTDGWLQGEAGDERAILGVMPRSQAFLDYACGPRAKALLTVSRDWWNEPGCLKVRYEDLVADPLTGLHRLTESIGIPPCQSLASAIASSTLVDLRRQFPERTHHFWQGKPGVWRALLTADDAAPIARAQAESFMAHGYAGDADSNLKGDAADTNWRDMLVLGADHDATISTLQLALFEVKRDLNRARHRLAELEAMGPAALGLARRLKRLASRFPRLTQIIKRIATTGATPESVASCSAKNAP